MIDKFLNRALKVFALVLMAAITTAAVYGTYVSYTIKDEDSQVQNYDHYRCK